MGHDATRLQQRQVGCDARPTVTSHRTRAPRRRKMQPRLINTTFACVSSKRDDAIQFPPTSSLPLTRLSYFPSLLVALSTPFRHLKRTTTKKNNEMTFLKPRVKEIERPSLNKTLFCRTNRTAPQPSPSTSSFAFNFLTLSNLTVFIASSLLFCRKNMIFDLTIRTPHEKRFQFHD